MAIIRKGSVPALAGAVVLAIVATISCGSDETRDEVQGEDAMTIGSGKQVSLEYTLKLEDEAVVESNVGRDPLTYVQGAGQIIPGLEKQLEGMQVGEAKQVTVLPEEAYGPVFQEAIREAPKNDIPDNALYVGAELQGQGPNGEVVRARVTEVREETVMVDFNHPLAGKTLTFDVKVVDIAEGQPQTGIETTD